MHLNELTAVSPLDGRYSDKIKDLRPICSEFGLIHYRVLVEIRWFIHLSKQPKIAELPPLSSSAIEYLEGIINHFTLEEAIAIKKLEETTNHDVKAVEYFLKQKMHEHSELEKVSEFVHFACTSEDINNLAYALIVKNTRDNVLLPVLKQLLNAINELAQKYRQLPMLARTHGQAASPTTLGKELAIFSARLQRQFHQLKTCRILGKINGAVGNFNAHCMAYPEVDWAAVALEFVEHLGIDYNPFTTQIEPHDFLAEFLQINSRINNILLDLARDIWGYVALGYFKQNMIKEEVGSSTMPHKVNPIDFENAEGNLGMANALYSHLANKLPISRWQRDLTDSTALRNIGVGFGHSLIAYRAFLKGLKKLEANQEALANDLNQNWAVLAEAIQTVMRRYGLRKPYERLKEFTRGRTIDEQCIKDFIRQLDLPHAVKQQLLTLTPSAYIGEAVALTDKMVNKNES